MSIQALKWAVEQQEYTEPHGRHVLLCLANYAGTDGRSAYPSVSTLARDTGLSERAVQDRLRRLEAAGLLVRGNRALVRAHARADRLPAVYDLALSRGARCAPRGAHGVQLALHGVHLGVPRGAQRAPDPSEIRREPKRAQRGAQHAPRAPLSTKDALLDFEADFARRFRRQGGSS